MQLYAALLYNCHVKGFLNGTIFRGNSKVLCVPGLNCYSCPGAVGACPLGALQNAVAASGQRAPAYVLGILLLYGLLLGRTVCGWLCPVGLLQEVIYKLPTPKIRKSNVTRGLSMLKYFILAALVFAVPFWYSYQKLPLPAFCKYVCPAGTLGGAIPLLLHPGNRGMLNALGVLFTSKFVILVAILLLCVFLFRAFCRFLCPLGALYSLFSRVSVLGVKTDKAKCTHCSVCLNVCKLDVRYPGDRECVHCTECIDACPTGAISFKAGKFVLRGNEGIPEMKAEANNKAKPKLWKRCLLVGAMTLLLGAAFWAANRDRADAQNAPAASENTVETVTPAHVDESVPVGFDPGQRAQNFTAPLNGQEGTFELYACAGRPVVINFWATWCTPCCLELPAFDQIAREYADEVTVVCVHSDLITDDIEEYLASYDYAQLFALDETGDIIASFDGSLALPQTVVVDARGVITYNDMGSMTYDKLKGLVTEALSRQDGASEE